MQGLRQQDQELVGETAAKLPWICPNADVLISLANDPIPLEKLSLEPAVAILAVRYVRPTLSLDHFRTASIRESVVVEAAAKLLETHTRFWLKPTPFTQELLENSRNLASSCRRLANESGTASPDAAAVVGLLAPLGWLALATVDAEFAASVREDCRTAANPREIQRSRCGLSHEEIARRLCERWRMPTWLSATITTLSLPEADAIRLGADIDLKRILHEAVQEGADGGLLSFASPQHKHGATIAPRASDPRTVELLPSLLRTAARAQRRANEHRLERAEAEVDRLRTILSETREQFETAVRDAKLVGLAELAAGAGHEINNPLAAIAGNAQRLAKTETDPERKKSLDSILRQSMRIGDIVRELMQFARPSAPNRSQVNLPKLIRDALAENASRLAAKNVTVEFRECSEAVSLLADGTQIRKAFEHLLRNALEATPDYTTVQVSLTCQAQRIRIGIEDSGNGPCENAIPHLFDPFFSGRTAGRGRGLGLPIAWRLATINGGDLQFCQTNGGPTRFELSFPTSGEIVPPIRKSA